MDLHELWPLRGPLPATILLALSTLYILLSHLSRRRLHPREPPVVSSPIPIPYIGHLLGMSLQGGHYLKSLGLAHSSLPVFTLAVPFSRLYVVTSPPLAAAVQRRPARQLSFHALLPHVVQRVMGLDAETRNIVANGLDPGPGEDKGFLAELHDMLASSLGPGGDLDELTARAATELGGELDRYAEEVLRAREGEGAVDELLPWVRRRVTRATARLLYGSRNPFALHPDQNLEVAFWDFDHGLGRLLMGIAPSVTASRAYRGRERLVAAFKEYIEAARYESSGEGDGGRGAVQIILDRIHIARSHGFSAEGMARSEVSFLFAGIVNTATTTFWMLLRIFSDPRLAATVRTELLEGGAVTKPRGGGEERQPLRLGLAALVRDRFQACAILHSVYREVLRLGSNHFSTRLVQADTHLGAAGHEGEYFLRRGGIVQIAGGVMHANRSIWGEDALVFNPGRHMRASSPRGGSRDRDGAREKVGVGASAVHPAAFRSFGGGKTMCPGRHFATREILALVAMTVLRFEIEGVDRAGRKKRLEVPEYDDYVLPVHILGPVAGKPVRVRMRTREGVDGERIEVVP